MTEQLHELVLDHPVPIEPRHMTQLLLRPLADPPAWLHVEADQIRFVHAGWFEILMTVEWETDNTTGTRFSHTTIPDHHPLHSEAIAAGVLAQISDGRQLLRGNSVFSPDGPSRLQLQVWQDSGATVHVRAAALQIRRLDAH